RQALPRKRLLVHNERDELPLGAARLDLAQLLRAAELLVERTEEAEACGDRVGLGRDVVAMERQGSLEPQRVTSAEPAGNCAALCHAIPQLLCVLGHHEQLASLLARVPGAVHEALDPVDLALGKRELPRRG